MPGWHELVFPSLPYIVVYLARISEWFIFSNRVPVRHDRQGGDAPPAPVVAIQETVPVRCDVILNGVVANHLRVRRKARPERRLRTMALGA